MASIEHRLFVFLLVSYHSLVVGAKTWHDFGEIVIRIFIGNRCSSVPFVTWLLLRHSEDESATEVSRLGLLHNSAKSNVSLVVK